MLRTLEPCSIAPGSRHSTAGRSAAPSEADDGSGLHTFCRYPAPDYSFGNAARRFEHIEPGKVDQTDSPGQPALNGFPATRNSAISPTVVMEIWALRLSLRSPTLNSAGKEPERINQTVNAINMATNGQHVRPQSAGSRKNKLQRNRSDRWMRQLTNRRDGISCLKIN